MHCKTGFYYFPLRLIQRGGLPPLLPPFPCAQRRANARRRRRRRRSYLLNVYFWLDLIAAASLVMEIPCVVVVLDTSNASDMTVARAGRAARIGTRAARILKIVRLVRLFRLLKVVHARYVLRPLGRKQIHSLAAIHVAAQCRVVL